MASQQSFADLEAPVVAAERLAQKAYDRGAVENVFSRYMHLHNHFEDEQIKFLWYTNNGVYTDYDSIMAYHTGRPAPKGKLILHYTEDGKSTGRHGEWCH
ncbi:hypothetical protein LTR09_011137 [Extremus antarcticus]|uniref:Uncharacterized protein n=1 Tax=Extremus antarcticus TaxID=702011 RepID=A0AAJ0DCI7_9PEZI|nr:hypothetical protein LTR09_011137 [Extremus antarcticus]